MALENCFQVSTVSCARAGVLQYHHPFSVKEKLNLPTCKGFKPSILSFSSSPSSLDYSVHSIISRKSRIVCKASEAVDEGSLTSPLSILILHLFGTTCSFPFFYCMQDSPLLLTFRE